MHGSCLRHSFDECDDVLILQPLHFIGRHAGKTLRNQNAFLEAGDCPTLTQCHVPRDGHTAFFAFGSRLPFLFGLRTLKKEFQGTKCECAMPVTLHVINAAVHFVARDEFGRRFFDDLRWRTEDGFEHRRKIIGQFPAKPVVRSFSHSSAARYDRLMASNGIENSPARPFTRRVFVIAKYHEVLRKLGLDTMEGVKQFKGELIKNHKGQRDVQRVTILLANPAGKLEFFLKRNWKPYQKDGLKSLFTRGEVWSQSRVEWENSLALQRAGIAVAEPIAFGEECGVFWEDFSFIITASAYGEMTLDAFLRNNSDAIERHRVFDSLAHDVRKMHDAGLASPDLFTRHVFLERGAIPKFCLIDMARVDRRKNLSAVLRARDLAALNVTAPLRFVSLRERLRFLRSYGGNRRIRQLIVKRTNHLLPRRKFADFAAA